MVLSETPLKALFTTLLALALLFTIISMFTPGWRYSDFSNEGVITDHYGDRQAYERWTIAFLVLALIFEVFTLIAAIAGFFRVATPPMLLALAGLAYIPALFLILVLIIYGASYHDAHGLGLLAYSRNYGSPLVPGFYPDLSLGFSYWFSLIAALLLIIAGLSYVVPAFMEMRTHRETKHIERHQHTHHITVHS